MPFPITLVVEISETDSRLARAIWADDCNAEFGKAIVRSGQLRSAGIAEIDETEFRFVGSTTYRDVQNSVSDMQESLKKKTPLILRIALAEKLQYFASTTSGRVFVEETSFLPEDISLTIQQGIPALLQHFKCIALAAAPENFFAVPWLLFIRSRNVVIDRNLSDAEIILPSESKTCKTFIERTQTIAGNQVIGAVGLQKVCSDIRHQLLAEPTTFIPREFIKWTWLQQWVGDLVPSTMFELSEILLTLLKVHFKKKTVRSDDLSGFRAAVATWVSKINELEIAWNALDSTNSEAFLQLCQQVLDPKKKLARSIWGDWLDSCQKHRSENPNKPIHEAVEQIQKKISTFGFSVGGGSYGQRNTEMGGLVRCENCGELLEKSGFCECNMD